MANITLEINNFRNAVYGEEVRGSMISLAEKLNSEIEASTANVNEQVNIVTNLKSQVDAVLDAEADRIANEEERIANENARKTAENSRVTAENARVAAENIRDAQEQGRVSAETNRVAAENQRVIDWNTFFNTAQTNWITFTASADAAETSRENIWNTFYSSITSDWTAFDDLARAAEEGRVTAENARTANWNAFYPVAQTDWTTFYESATTDWNQFNQNAKEDEDLRVTQENSRVAAETRRNQLFNQLTAGVVPLATYTTPGTVIPGDGLAIDEDGVLSVVGGTDLETATHAAATYLSKSVFNTTMEDYTKYASFMAPFVINTELGNGSQRRIGLKFHTDQFAVASNGAFSLKQGITWADLATT